MRTPFFSERKSQDVIAAHYQGSTSLVKGCGSRSDERYTVHHAVSQAGHLWSIMADRDGLGRPPRLLSPAGKHSHRVPVPVAPICLPSMPS